MLRVISCCLEKDDSYSESPKLEKYSFWTAEIHMIQTKKVSKMGQ